VNAQSFTYLDNRNFYCCCIYCGLLIELDSLKNPIDANNVIPLENGLSQTRVGGGGVGGSSSGVGLAVKGPLKLSQEPVLKVSGATGVSYLRVIAGETYTGTSWLPPQSDVSQTLAPGADLPYHQYAIQTIIPTLKYQ